MSLGRAIASFLVTVLLLVTVGVGAGLGVAHTTVLDPGFVTETMEEEDGYGMVLDQVASTLNESGGENLSAAGIDARAVIEASVTEEYLATQTERNVERTYAYLHGNRDTLNLSVNVAPVKDNVAAAIESEVANASLAEMVAQANVSEDAPVNADLLANLTANESGYQQARSDFRDNVREEVLDAMVDETFTDRNSSESGRDQLLELVVEDYDPSAHTDEEKQAMVADREDEIRQELRAEIEAERGDEVDQAVDDQLATLEDDYTGENATGDTEVEQAVADVQAVVVTGLVGDQDYETFSTDLADAKADLAAALSSEVATRLDEEMPDRIDLTEEMGGRVEGSLSTARDVVTWLDRLAIAVPAAVVVLLGLLYGLTGSALAVSRNFGLTLLTTGLPIHLGVGFLRPRVESFVTGADVGPAIAEDLALGFVGRFLDATADVGLALTVGGGVLLAVWAVVALGVLDRLLALEALSGVRERVDAVTADAREAVGGARRAVTDRVRDAVDAVRDLLRGR